jgi:hypothetical protein
MAQRAKTMVIRYLLSVIGENTDVRHFLKMNEVMEYWSSGVIE